MINNLCDDLLSQVDPVSLCPSGHMQVLSDGLVTHMASPQPPLLLVQAPTAKTQTIKVVFK